MLTTHTGMWHIPVPVIKLKMTRQKELTDFTKNQLALNYYE